ncbi:DUF637 domain-containing protein [Halomonas sp. A29]|uniref:two-partner secretion domain-containing protein n=1 Tax=Halomonas sp. A29 TaxID=3102786 RepID=UPI00398B14D2
MNRQCYRLIFNRAKGQLVAASELAVATGKSPAEGSRVERRRLLRQPAIAATLAALLLGSPLVQASIASDPSAPGNQRPTVLETANGVPQVNIQTPSAAGVSRNSYRQFDVSSKGVILNNSRSNTQTQLGGWVQGNPHLTSGEARVILNEVNSANPSQLRGYLEVAGSRAEVVIANPAGIDVNGAGFINASRATLTTGTPELRNGELTGYRVQDGRVRISGAGLDASGTDYTAVLARAVEVQGGVWANDLNVVAGANRIGADGQVIERLNTQGNAPQVAIDVAHLGGMYAGKIRLVATEAGVGVNNAGNIAATHAGGVGEVVLTAEGRIVNRGSITAEGDIRLASQARIDNLGAGTILAQGDLELRATAAQGSIHSAAGATLAAGVDAGSLSLGDSGQLTLTAGDSITAQGRNLAGGGFLAEADTVSLAGSETQARNIDITARRGDINASGATLTASDTLTASAAATLRTDDASVQAERLELSAANLSNRDGELVQAGNDTLNLTTGTLDNSGGRVIANAGIAIRADALNNAAGTVRAGGSLDIESETLDNSQGRLVAEHDLSVSANRLDNTQGLMGAVQGTLDVAAESLDNTRGRIEAADGLRLEVADTLTNEAGEIVQLSDQGELQIATANLHGSDGLIVSQGDLTVEGGEIVLDGARTQAQHITLQADWLQHRGGELLHLGADASLTLDVAQTLDNSAGLIASNADLVLQAGEMINREGTLQAAGDTQLSLSELDNQAGELVAGGRLDIDVQGELNNSQGQLVAEGDLHLSAGRLNNAQGLMGAVQGSLDVAATTLNNAQGRIEAADGLRLDVADTLTNEAGEIVQLSDQGELQVAAANLHGSDGLIVSRGDLALQGGEFVLDGARTQAQHITLQADRLQHRGGELIHLGTDASLTLDVAQAVDNTQGLIASNTDLVLRGGELTNQGGTLQAAGDARFILSELDNQAGEIVVGAVLDIEVQGVLDNSHGQLLADAAHLAAGSLVNREGLISAARDGLSISSTALDNTQGQMEAVGNVVLTVEGALVNLRGSIMQLGEGELRLSSASLANTNGFVAANGDLALQAGSVANLGGTLQAAGDAYVNAVSLDNRQGELVSGGTLGLTVEGSVANAQGQLLAQRSLDLKAASLGNAQGAIGTVEGDLTLTIGGTIDNGNGSMEAGGRLRSNSLELNNQGGALLGEHVTLNTAGRRLDNTAGQIAARDVLTIVSGVLDNTGGTLRSGGNLTLDTQGRSLLNRDNADAGGILANGTLVMRSGLLDNSGGLVGAGGLEIEATGVTNRNGTLFSRGELTLAATELDNRSGEMLALGDIRLVLGDVLRNQGGLVRALGLLDIAARRLLNGTTLGDEQGIEGHRVSIAADEIHNRQGAMRADERLDLVSANGIDNRDGLLSSRHTLDVRADDLDNQGGTLVANQRLALNLVRLPGSGRLLSLGDLAFQLASDFILGQGEELKAAGDLQLATTGNLTNRGTLQAGATLDLAASTIVNAASGELSGTTTRLTAGLLTNRGLIDGVTTRIEATTLDNLGTGRIYGDWLGIQANTLTNQRAGGISPVIAARERLDLGVRNLTNRDEALIFSAGDLAIAGRLNAAGNATGQARRIDNNSATIEALGDMTIAADVLNNTNDYFETRLELVGGGPQQVTYLQPSGWSDKRPIGDFYETTACHNRSRSCVLAYYHEPTDRGVMHWWEYELERIEYTSRVITSLPGEILSGGNLAISGGSLVNDKSKVLSGGVLTTDLASLKNVEALGEQRIQESGKVRWSYWEQFHQENNTGDITRYWTEWEDYSGGTSTTTIDLKAGEFGGNRNPAGTGTQINAAQNNVTINGSASGTGTIKPGVGNVNVGGGMIEVPARVPASITSRSGDLSLVDTSAVGSQARADRQSTEAQSVDRRATADLPRDVIRTLTPQLQLPSNSLFQLRPTGIRPLVETDPRFTNQREWLSSDYLLSALHPDPAMTQKRLGDGFYEQRLIREQVTQLTGQRFLEGYADDEAQYAALMNNAATFAQQHGLRPGVALTAEQMAQLTSDIVWLVEQTVTLADGSTVKVLVPQVYARVREGDLRGDGTLIAGSSLNLNVANELVNSGTLAGRQGVTVSADRIANLNGRISGDEVSLMAASDLLHRGGDIDGRAVTLFAGRDLTLQGGGVTAERELTLQAGRDLALTSQAGRQTALTVTDADGLLQAGAGRDLTIAGAALDSAGSLALGAGRDLNIASTLDTQSNRYGRVTLNSASIDYQATLTAGQNLILNAGRDLSLAAVDVTAGGNGLIAAGRDLALETLATGSAMSGGRLQRSQQQEVGTTLAFGNDLTLMAGQDLYARAANVSAAGDLAAIAGRDIEIEAGHSSQHDERRTRRTHTIDSQSRVQGSDFSAGGNLTLTAGEDLRLTASRLQAGEGAALLAGGNIEFLTAQEHDYSLYESRRRGTFGGSRTQRDEVSQTRLIGSEVTTGGDLLIVSGQDQTYQAARLDAGGDIALQSGGTIRFETASDVHTESHERSKSSFAWQSASGEGFTRETLRQSELVAQGELIIQAAQGIHIDVEQIDRHSVTRTIDAMVAANPDLAWLKEMEQRGDVDWQQVKAFHDSWDYSHSGLGPGAALAVAVVVTYFTAGAASGLVASGVSAAGASTAAGSAWAAASAGASAGWANVAATAAMTSMATTATVSAINSRGDLGATFEDTFSSDSLRGAATAALTAGATRGMTDQYWGTQTNPTTGATNNLNLSFGQGSDIARFAGQRATQAVIDAGIRSAVEGGSYRSHLGDSLENAVHHVVSGVLFNAVGDRAFDNRWDEGSPQKIALHALTGGLVAEAMGGDFRTGALAAGASEALVHHLVENGRANPVLSNTIAQLVGIVAAELSGGDVNNGAFIAGQVESYNRQLHSEERKLARDLADLSEGRFTLEEIEQAMRGMHNLANGEAPGDNIIVPLLPGLGSDELGYYDFGGQWVNVTLADGSQELRQVVPNAPRELANFIIRHTGGENSPYWIPPVQTPNAREPQLLFPGSIAMAAGLPYNLNGVDTRTPLQQQQDMDAFVRGVSSMAALPFGAGSFYTLGTQRAAGYFATGAGFDMAGQSLQGGEYRYGQTLAAGGTALVYGPLAGRSLWNNAAVGGAAGGTHTAVTNRLYDEGKPVGRSALLGAGTAGVGTVAGGVIGQRLQHIPGSVSVPYFQTPATINIPLPSAESVGNGVQMLIGNMPAIISFSDAEKEGGR